MDELSKRIVEIVVRMSLEDLRNEVLKSIGENRAGKTLRKNSPQTRPRRRGKWAEERLASYFRKKGCGVATNVFYGRWEVDVLAACRRGGDLHLLVVEVKSGRQLIDTPVLSRLKRIVKHILESKRPYIRLSVGPNPPENVIVHALLVIGPRCALSPGAEKYALKNNIEVYRYTTQPSFRLSPINTN